jgi:hypothetical protein
MGMELLHKAPELLPHMAENMECIIISIDMTLDVKHVAVPREGDQALYGCSWQGS